MGKIFSLSSIVPFLFKLLFAPRDSVLLFNHTKRIRKNGAAEESLYAGRLAADIPGLIVIDEVPTEVTYGKGAWAFNAGWVPLAAGILRRFDRQNTPELAVFFCKKFIWKQVFRLLRVKKVFLVVWYGKEWAVAAAKDLGIPVVELQHGIIYEQHPFYNIAKDQGVPGSDYLLPDLEYVYGKYWLEKHVKMGWEPERVKICGFYLDVARKNLSPVLTEPFILYTSQPGFDYAVKAHIRSVLAELERRKVIAVIAPHPAEPLSLFDDIVGPNVKIFPEFDSYDLLAGCECHVSLSSTLLIEAILFGKPSYQLDLGENRKFLWNLDDLVSHGINRKLRLGEFPEFKSTGADLVPKAAVEYFFERYDPEKFLKL